MMTSYALSSSVIELAEQQNNFGDTRGGALAGPLALFIIVLLAIATVFLIRNMNKRLRALPPTFNSQGKTPTAHPESDDKPEQPAA